MADKEREFTVFHLVAIILDVVAFIFVIILEIILRATKILPVRQTNFSCFDTDINQPMNPGTPYPYFDYNAVASYGVVVGLSFGIPVLLIVVGEIARWALAKERQQSLRTTMGYLDLKVSQLVRRIFRYVFTFIFGLLITMIFTDVFKIFSGRLRPCFVDLCMPKPSLCTFQLTDESICQGGDDNIRYGRLSFPSLHTSVSSFAGTFMAIYTHRTMVSPDLWLLRPFLVFSWMIMPVMAGVSRYGMNQSHSLDVFWGFIMGSILAVYFCVWCLNEFHEHNPGRVLLYALRSYMYNNSSKPFVGQQSGTTTSEEPYSGSYTVNSGSRVQSSETLVVQQRTTQVHELGHTDVYHQSLATPHDDVTTRYPRSKQQSPIDAYHAY